MRHRFKYFLVLLLGIFALTSCNDDPQFTETKKEIQLVGSKWCYEHDYDCYRGKLWFEFINESQVKIYMTDIDDDSKVRDMYTEKYTLDYPRIYISVFGTYGFSSPGRMGNGPKYTSEIMVRVE